MREKVSVLAIIIITIGCSQKIVGVYNTDIVNNSFKTFGIQASNMVSGSSENQNLDSLLQNIISSGLKDKGLKRSSIPDLYASYLINIHPSSREVNANYDPYSLNNYQDPFYNNVDVRTYKEGVLIINLKNDREKLVWQGSKAFKLKTKQRIHQVIPQLCSEVINAFDINRIQ